MHPARRARFGTLLVALTIAAALAADLAPASAQAGPCAPPVTNPIACENSKPGNPQSEWDIPSGDAGDAGIQGFATDISVNKGQTVTFKVKTPATNYRLDIYRLGYYGGAGARKVATVEPSVALPQSQPACLSQAATGLVDCGNWAVSASWPVPADAVSGIYLARLVREDAGGVSHVAFVVRDDGGASDVLFQAADTTWQAYNNYGGKSLYDFNSTGGRAVKVSYNRPFSTRSALGGPRESFLFNAEYPMVRWLEANGYKVSYTTGVDSDRRGAEIREHRVFLSVGHDEYWSAQQRANVEAARDAGVHLAFFSGNEVFWKTRWENSIDGSGTQHRTLVCYKETLDGAKTDPLPNTWTGTWRDPRFSPPADGGRPENALTGTIFMVNGIRNDAISVPAADGKMRFWRNTSIATQSAGQTATLPTGTLGYEWDEDRDNGSRPPGLIRLSSTTVTNITGQYLLDHGASYGNGTGSHSLTLYRHSGGALVFGAGTVQWSWGLDGVHDRGPSTPDARMQQATVNLLADMGAQPGTLQAGLSAATASTDTARPDSTITSPADGASIAGDQPATIGGTASDSGGVVGAVEVSVDGGTTWRSATGRGSWSFSWTPTKIGEVTLKSRAVDDSGNLELPGGGVTVTVNSATATFDDLTAPDRPLNGEYPTDEIDWGSGAWWLSRPWRSFTTNSVSFPTSTATSGSFAFVPQRVLKGLRAFNGGSGSTTVSISCAGLPTKTQAVGANAVATVTTGWTTACSPVTVASTNGWDTNFDDFSVGLGIPDTTPPTISALQARNVTAASATITWTTDEPADSQVEYGPTTAYGSTTTLDTAQVTAHSAQLTGLQPNTLHHYRVKSKDGAGNLATSADGTFTTAAPDTTPPTISAPQATNVTGTGATITWTTNEAADSQVEYGTTDAYGSSTTLDPALATAHSVPLSGLAASTTYHYRVKSKDAAGNPAASVDLTFTTAAPPPASQTVTFDDKPGQDQPLNGQYPTGVIDWGSGKWYHSGPWGPLTTKNISFDSAAATSQTFTFVSPRRLVSLRAYNGGGGSTTINLSCAGQTTKTQAVAAGQVATVSSGWSGTCSTVTVGSSNGWNTNFDDLAHDDGGAPDTTPPTISAVQATGVTAAGATIAWTTNEASDSQVEYGTTTAYGSSTTLNPAPVTAHSVPLSGLTAATTYHYRVKSKDAAGNPAVSADFTFTTAAPDTTAPTISAVQATNVVSTGATITWTTNEPADSQVDYGPTTAYGSSTTLNPSLVTSHSVALSGLTPGTLYHYRVKSKDAAGNSATSSDSTFTTAAQPTTQTVTFNDKSGQDQALNGQYPAGVIDWGTNKWYHSAPFGALTTKSASFNGGGVTSQTFTFVSSRRLVSLKAYNSAGSSTTVALKCAGQPDKVQTVAARQVVTITTAWTGTCGTVTVQAGNGWDTNFDDLVHDGGP